MSVPIYQGPFGISLQRAGVIPPRHLNIDPFQNVLKLPYDTTLTVTDGNNTRQFLVSRSVLIRNSNYFRALLEGNFRRDQTILYNLQLFSLLIDAMYGYDLDRLANEEAIDFARTLDFFDVKFVKAGGEIFTLDDYIQKLLFHYVYRNSTTPERYIDYLNILTSFYPQGIPLEYLSSIGNLILLYLGQGHNIDFSQFNPEFIIAISNSLPPIAGLVLTHLAAISTQNSNLYNQLRPRAIDTPDLNFIPQDVILPYLERYQQRLARYSLSTNVYRTIQNQEPVIGVIKGIITTPSLGGLDTRMSRLFGLDSNTRIVFNTHEVQDGDIVEINEATYDKANSVWIADDIRVLY